MVINSSFHRHADALSVCYTASRKTVGCLFCMEFLYTPDGYDDALSGVFLCPLQQREDETSNIICISLYVNTLLTRGG